MISNSLLLDIYAYSIAGASSCNFNITKLRATNGEGYFYLSKRKAMLAKKLVEVIEQLDEVRALFGEKETIEVGANNFILHREKIDEYQKECLARIDSRDKAIELALSRCDRPESLGWQGRDIASLIAKGDIYSIIELTKATSTWYQYLVSRWLERKDDIVLDWIREKYAELYGDDLYQVQL